ncbi:MAG: hypothetical protein AB1646_02735 [Thermodesulfobacteriota bacterium]
MYGFITKLVGMIILGCLSAALSYYNRNYFVRVFDDILGREEEENTETKLGRGFIYGFLFPVYFVLLLFGLLALAVFLVIAGILAGIAFALVWVTEKIIPKDTVGTIVKGVFDSLGIKGSQPPFEPASVPPATSSASGARTGAASPASPAVPLPSSPAPAPPSPSAGEQAAAESPAPAAPSIEMEEVKPTTGDAPESGEKKDKPEEPKP